jgi:hypothetical protein
VRRQGERPFVLKPGSNPHTEERHQMDSANELLTKLAEVAKTIASKRELVGEVYAKFGDAPDSRAAVVEAKVLLDQLSLGAMEVFKWLGFLPPLKYEDLEKTSPYGDLDGFVAASASAKAYEIADALGYHQPEEIQRALLSAASTWLATEPERVFDLVETLLD